ncbi:MAG: hypothetical protein PF488_04135 [Patescibacteria group bacterium]|jgi:hypothetical protein|nr:hypothetical protein [Patescibacteria group bacterium]
MPQNNNRSNFSNLEKKSKTQKIASILLVVFGVFLIGFSISQFRDKIVSPFRLETSEMNKITQDEKINFHLAVLQNMDTDEDGLSDYEEIYVYDISPYLEDTDSDELSDYAEIQRGSDPNCPEGEDCSVIGSIQTPVDNNEEFTDVYDNNENSVNTGDNMEGALVETISTGEVDVTVLRELMLSNGFNKEELDQISDEDLKMIYLEAITKQSE